MSGSTIGIVGLGNIGRAVAERAKGFKMNILYHNRTRKEELEKYLGKTELLQLQLGIFLLLFLILSNSILLYFYFTFLFFRSPVLFRVEGALRRI